jgi:diguanylate cyclase (GGDEF)-like protein
MSFMSVVAAPLQDLEASAAPGAGASDLLALVPGAPVADSTLIAWAQGVAAAAERRVALLEERIAYLESLVATDELTGILNRRGFLDAFMRANAAARRGGPRGVVILCDLDGFKEVNDRLGHAQGDQMLREMGAVLRRNTRRMDAVARLGGDEFALLLISASVMGARRKCQHLSRSLAAIGINASFGLAVFDGSEDEEAVLHRADTAMYEQKRRRARNHVAPRNREPVSPSASSPAAAPA